MLSLQKRDDEKDFKAVEEDEVLQIEQQEEE